MQFSNPAIHVDEIPKHEELILHPVQPAYKNVMFIERFIWWLLISAGIMSVLIGVPFFKNTLWVIAGISFCLLLIVTFLFTATKSYQNMGYTLRKHDIVFRKGWLFEKLHIVPLTKIQHCELKRGPLERNYDLASLKIFTAGSVGADVTLSGLPFAEAERLKDWMVSGTEIKANEVIEKDIHAAGME